MTGVVAAAALMLGRFATPSRFAAAHLHTTLDVIAVFHRLTDTVAGSLPDGVWYGGIALCALAYVALFFPDRVRLPAAAGAGGLSLNEGIFP